MQRICPLRSLIRAFTGSADEQKCELYNFCFRPRLSAKSRVDRPSEMTRICRRHAGVLAPKIEVPGYENPNRGKGRSEAESRRQPFARCRLMSGWGHLQTSRESKRMSASLIGRRGQALL